MDTATGAKKILRDFATSRETIIKPDIPNRP